jgi:diguanylate cyclase (GGDEF)-like protein
MAKDPDTPPDISKEVSRLQRELLSANRRLKVREQQIRDLSLIDALTGVANRRRLEEAIEAGVSHAARHKRALSIVMADIDDFKTLNDDFGHDTGDRALRAFAELLKLRSRKYDLVARYGAEEFIVLMPECDMSHARTTAERMRKEVALLNIPPADRPMTASFGVSQWLEADTAQSFLARADAAMNQAKAKGRNRVETKKA